jgi:uncharacterized protein YecT (DUF1311 family)
MQKASANERNMTVLEPKLRPRLQAGLALFACLVGPQSYVAVANAQSMPKIDCATAVNTHELNWCSEQALDKADRKLNETYKRVLAQITASDTMSKAKRDKWTAAVREAQRRWIAFRDQDCGEVTGYEWAGGTGMTGAMLGCRLSKTEARTKELDERMPEN